LAEAEKNVTGIDDIRLREALARLGARILSEKGPSGKAAL